MKGLILSLIVFAFYVLSTIVLSHLLHPRRHGRLLLYPIFAWIPVFFLLYVKTPADLLFLPPSWQAGNRTLDMAFGFFVYLLNCHSFFDFFFGFNGGFSMSLLLEILRADQQGMKAETLIAGYYNPDGTDKIYGWRVPQLVDKKYVVIEPHTNACRLTPKGRFLAGVAIVLKRILNLGEGG